MDDYELTDELKKELDKCIELHKSGKATYYTLEEVKARWEDKRKKYHARKFKLPRKLKKLLKNNIWMYPPDENGDSLAAWPATNKKDFEAYKRGELTKLKFGFSSKKNQSRLKKGVSQVDNNETTTISIDEL